MEKLLIVGNMINKFIVSIAASQRNVSSLGLLFVVDESTAWLNRIAHLAVGILLLHHYKSDFAHLSYLYSLVIGLYKS